MTTHIIFPSDGNDAPQPSGDELALYNKAGALHVRTAGGISPIPGPPKARGMLLPNTIDISTSSTTWTDISTTSLSLSIVTAGGPVLLGFSGVFSTTSNVETVVQLDFAIDGLRYAGGDGLAVANVRSGVVTLQHDHVLMQVLIMNLAAGPHVFRSQWRLASGASVMLRGGATVNAQFRPHLWAIEF